MVYDIFIALDCHAAVLFLLAEKVLRRVYNACSLSVMRAYFDINDFPRISIHQFLALEAVATSARRYQCFARRHIQLHDKAPPFPYDAAIDMASYYYMPLSAAANADAICRASSPAAAKLLSR